MTTWNSGISGITKYAYKVLNESDPRTLECKLNQLGSEGWKLVNVVWDNDESLLVASLMRKNKVRLFVQR